MKIGVESNKYRDLDFAFANEVVDYLESENVEVTKLYLSDFKEYTKLCADLDFAIVIGGDGTILNFIQHIEDKNIRILGINNGNLGYLTDVDANHTYTAIDSILAGVFEIEKRIMIECQMGDVKKIALNDIYINKAQNTKLLELNVEINGSELEVFRGDGIIVTTPTGSTAYNLSAGGAILKPDGNMLGITPVCPHMLYNRPVIVDGDDKIKLSVKLREGQSAVSYLDGELFCDIKKDVEIEITKSKQFVRLVKTQNKNFYNVLKDKML